MDLPDVNILVYAHRGESAHHQTCRTWLDRVLASDQAFGISELVLSGFVRVVTNPGIFKSPTPLDVALLFARTVREQAHATRVSPGSRHWEIFTTLCTDAGAKGNLVADAYLAAMAIESGCEWVTTDGDFARFPGLKWRRPF
jgi:toxin-antitoxin system PIN domain toxin